MVFFRLLKLVVFIAALIESAHDTSKVMKVSLSLEFQNQKLSYNYLLITLNRGMSTMYTNCKSYRTFIIIEFYLIVQLSFHYYYYLINARDTAIEAKP